MLSMLLPDTLYVWLKRQRSAAQHRLPSTHSRVEPAPQPGRRRAGAPCILHMSAFVLDFVLCLWSNKSMPFNLRRQRCPRLEGSSVELHMHLTYNNGFRQEPLSRLLWRCDLRRTRSVSARACVCPCDSLLWAAVETLSRPMLFSTNFASSLCVLQD